MTNNCTVMRMFPENNIYGCVETHGFVVWRHWHAEIEFVYVVKGKLEIEIEDTKYEVEEGQFIIVSPDTLHDFVSTEADSLIWVARIYLTDILTCAASDQSFSDIYRCSIIVQATDKMKEIMKELEFANYGVLNKCYAVLKATELTIEILHNKSCIKKSIRVEMIENSATIVKMQRFIESSLHKDITLPMVAEYLGFSPSYCSKYIKKKTNQNFLDYVSAIRMREAETLLSTSDMSITDISYNTGFNSIQSFNRIFKKSRGVTPTEYRKNCVTKNSQRWIKIE